MTITIVESKDKALLDAFKHGMGFAIALAAEPFADGSEPTEYVPTVTQGENQSDEEGVVHWLLIEDPRAADNATYRLDAEGVHFEASGVEV